VKVMYDWRWWVKVGMFFVGIVLLIFGMIYDFAWWIDLAMEIAGWVFLLTGGATLYNWLKFSDQGYPGEKEIEAFLLDQFVLPAILAAYQVSESIIDDGMLRLRGADKKTIAVWLYGQIPNVLRIGGFVVPVGIVRKFVSQERFADLIQQGFDEMERVFGRVWENYTDEIDVLLGIAPSLEP